MKHRFIIHFFVASILGVSVSPLWAQTVPDVLSKNKCLSCHQVNQKRVGPSFEMIAERYQSDEAAMMHLESSIKHGGSGRWGRLNMPPQTQVTKTDIEEISRWILSLKK